MTPNQKVPYHCSFLIDPAGKDLKLAIAWRRVGAGDYGVYLACDESVSAVFFAANYSPQGELKSFLVCDRFPRDGLRWDEDHLSGLDERPLIDKRSKDILKEMSNCFYAEWLESFAATEAVELLTRLSDGDAEHREPLSLALAGDLPLQIKPSKMADLLEVAQLTDGNFLYAFLPNEDLGVGDRGLLESKMRLFLELI